MTGKRITITLDQGIEKWLRPEAEASKRSMSELVRVCLREYSDTDPFRYSAKQQAGSDIERAWKKPSRISSSSDQG